MLTVDPYATGQNLKELMIKRNITPLKLSKLLGFTTTHAIYKWFRGENLPTIDNLVTIAYILDVSMDDIVITRRYEYVRIS